MAMSTYTQSMMATLHTHIHTQSYLPKVSFTTLGDTLLSSYFMVHMLCCVDIDLYQPNLQDNAVSGFLTRWFVGGGHFIFKVPHEADL